MFGGLPGLLEFKASLLASHGFAAMALAFLGDDVNSHYLENNLIKGNLEYFRDCEKYMINHPNILSSGLGVVSISFSVHIALLMSVYFKHIRSVVCINGFIYNFSVSYYTDDSIFSQNEPAFMPMIQNYIEIMNSATYDNSSTERANMYDLYPRVPVEKLKNESEPGCIPFYKKKNVSFMMITGLDDKCLDAGYMAYAFERLLKDNNHPNFCVLKYPSAGHLIEPPYGPCNSTTRFRGSVMDWGGSPQPHAFAQEDSWFKMLNFLQTNLLPPSKF